MAKNQPKQQSNKAISQVQGFTGGMFTDPDPRYQIKGSYRDALNIRLINDGGDSFTVENILGNKKIFNLDEIIQQEETGAAGDNTGILGTRTSTTGGDTVAFEKFSEIYIDPKATDANKNEVGDFFPSPNNQMTGNTGSGINPFSGSLLAQAATPVTHDASIVGHYSYNNNVIFIIVKPDLVFSTRTQTIFLDVLFDKDLNVERIYDLHVSYDYLNRYPDLNMDLDVPVRVEGIVENECISRIFWTDNKNPLRSINLGQPGKNRLSPDVLDLTPLHSPSQAVVTKTISGSLPVGQLQYCYKYVSSNGGESVMSPFSNLYHTTKQTFGSSQNYYGSASGDPFTDVSSQGFEITVKDLDNDFDIIELYAILHTENDGPIRVSLAASQQYANNSQEVTFYHTNWNGDLPDGVETILIDINTWEVCKDIAIKDNILFAANLKTRDNTISEKEWNVKVRRYNIADADSGGSSNTGVITSDDSQIKEYEIDSSGDTTTVAASLGETWSNGMPKWRTYKGDDVTTVSGSDIPDQGRVDIVKKQSHEYRYLSDGLTLGGESYDYSDNGLGGCRVTFGLKEKQVDVQHNTDVSPYISAGAIQGQFTDNISDDGAGGNVTDNTDTEFTATMSLGGSKDPATGNFKGYRRGEMYRFGVQVYDKNGRPGNVLWIGDIEMPEMNDPVRTLKVGDSDYDPGLPTYGTGSLYSKKLLGQHELTGDHKTSVIFGASTPSVDVAWFNQTIGAFTDRKTQRYVLSGAGFSHRAKDGTNVTQTHVINPTTTTNTGAGLDLLSQYVHPNGNWNIGASLSAGWYSPKVIELTNGIDHNNCTVKQLPNRYRQNSRDNTHYTLDLYVNFEFRIPSDVREKMSGFRVVRAERQESDKSIIQQGLLNQTVAYGNQIPKYGYYNPDGLHDDDSEQSDIFMNDSSSGLAVLHNPYDSYLNGYIGLAENSNLAFYDSNSNNARSLLSGNATRDDNIYAFEEFEEAGAKFHAGVNGPRMFKWWDTPYDYDQDFTPGNYTPKRRHSAYFGSYEVLPNTRETWSMANGHDLHKGYDGTHWCMGATAQAVQGSVFTLDCPDSAFGTSSYSFRSGDKIRVDAMMRLIYEWIPEYTASTGVSGSNTAFGGNNHTGNAFDGGVNMSASLPNASPGGPLAHVVQATHGSFGWDAVQENKTAKEALRYCKRLEAENNNGMLIAKYYMYDTYYGIGMSVDGGAGYATNYRPSDGINLEGYSGGAGSVSNIDTRYIPAQHHDIYLHEILNAKELGAGEVVGSSFFKDGVLMIDKGEIAFSRDLAASESAATNKMAGFSNNTLGFYNGGRYKITDGGNTVYSGGTSFSFGVMEECADARGGNEHDRTYDTISTVQCGLRSILIQIDGDGDVGEKRGLLNPRDLATILEHRSWAPVGADKKHLLHHSVVANDKIQNRCNLNPSSTPYTDNGGPYGGPSYIPHKFLCSIVRNNIPYGGSTKNSLQSTRYIPAGNFHPIKKDAGGNSEESHLSTVFGGDTFVNFYSHQKTACAYENRSMARFQVFPVESDTTTDMRMGYHLNAGDTNIGDVQDPDSPGEGNWNDWNYNFVYNQENNLRSAISVDESVTCQNLELPYEIAYSETKISGEKQDSFKIFLQNSFHDMESQYGEITRLVNWRNDLYVLQEKSMSKLLVNPISMIQDELGTTLNVGTGETVENHLYITTKYGTRNMDSVVSSESAIYYIDNTYGKLMQYTGESLKAISDDLGQRDALRSIIKGDGSLDTKQKIERRFICDNPLKFNGITSVFDYKNNELIITMHSSVLNTDNQREETEIGTGENRTWESDTNSRTLVYSESIGAFTSYYSVTPKKWMNIGGYVVCTESERFIGERNSYNSNYLSLWKWDEQINNYKTVFFDENITPAAIEESSITKTISEIPSISKVFDNAKIVMSPDKNNLSNTFVSYETDTTTLETIDINNNTAAKYKEGILRFPLRVTGPRQRGTYINIKYSTNSTEKFNIFAILAKYRKSYQ